ncbi:hypothetical protein ACH42_09045 [Endozoicomonas sp. (ex Bugula neritina AB1)]|nr:hypothetical protein ACH42_09045 [Endozoicomonas sp. (ex Bugula neritina AB1)]
MTEESLASPGRRALFRRFSKPEPVELPQSKYPRPPWAQENRAFLSLCNRCNLCVENCPRRVLRKSEEDLPVLNNTPVLSLDYGSCDYCGECVDHCPTGALSREKGTQIQTVATLSGNCQRALDPYCDLCVDACTEKAIDLNPKSIVIDHDKCTGCGECSLDCYSKAISIIKC